MTRQEERALAREAAAIRHFWAAVYGLGHHGECDVCPHPLCAGVRAPLEEEYFLLYERPADSMGASGHCAGIALSRQDAEVWVDGANGDYMISRSFYPARVIQPACAPASD